MQKEYTVTVYTEDRIGITNRITIIFTRRGINITSLTTAETEIPGVFKFIITVMSTREQLDKVVGQIERLIEIHRAFVHEEEEVVYQELALYKISTRSLDTGDIERLIRDHQARILTITADYFVIEKTGHQQELIDFIKKLEPYGLIEYSKSGRVAIVKWSRRFHEHLKDLAAVEADNLISND
ncbi:acetolactate synthase small subunit [Chitinophaga nivalis]|uniref:Acetolactate synthase small subunit n=1 Tax=Chitinophaga nivalis TaxID=2991709 RepID=A0ABT3IFU5_9BACT|nr:acetolactate synthase small subunit [Chitinophaga nivalis]MCW3467480.1 acetolactate synthase small subunit [Chitinophaga nivalis]MCW3482828.1 acetolactate synthase small subunit [Chitinophaga nivalis]